MQSLPSVWPIPEQGEIPSRESRWAQKRSETDALEGPERYQGACSGRKRAPRSAMKLASVHSRAG